MLSNICFTNVLQGQNKKGLHFCNPLIFIAPPQGLEPWTP